MRYFALFVISGLTVAPSRGELVEEMVLPSSAEQVQGNKTEPEKVKQEESHPAEAAADDSGTKEDESDENTDDAALQKDPELTDFISSIGEATDHDTNDDTEEDNEKNVVEYNLPEEKNSSAPQEAENFEALMNNAIELSEISVQLLNKQSSKAEDVKFRVNQPVEYGTLSIVLKRAFMTAEDVIPFSVVGYFEVYEDNKLIFNNWMCGTYPSAVTFDHAIYDIKINNEKD